MSAIVKSKKYVAVERTSDFLSRISAEQEYQRTGAVDNMRLCEIGKQLGADYVCVADITPYKDSYYLQARVINVVNSQVDNTARQISTLGDISEIVRVSEKLATDLLEVKQIGDGNPILQEHQLSTCLSQPLNAKLKNIEITNTSTDVSLVVYTQGVGYMAIDAGTYIVDKSSGIYYELIDVDNISVAPRKTYPKTGEISRTVVLHFEPIPLQAHRIDIIEPSSGSNTGWEWKDIRLNPDAKEGRYTFHVEGYEPIPSVVKVKQRPGQHQYSTCLSMPSTLRLLDITIDQNFTNVHCRFVNDNVHRMLSANSGMYIIDCNTGRRYMLKNVINLQVYPQKKEVFQGQRFEFVLQFEPIPLNTSLIDIVHPRDNVLLNKDNAVYFNFERITLIPYSQEGDYQFKPVYN